MTDYLPDLRGVEVGSPAQDNLRYACDVLKRHLEWITDADEAFRCRDAILTLKDLTRTDAELIRELSEGS